MKQRQTIPLVALGAVAIFGLVITSTGGVAAADSSLVSLASVQPGTLTSAADAAEWAQANQTSLLAQGYSPNLVAATKDSNQIRVNPTTGQVTAPAGTSVDYVLGDASARLALQLGNETETVRALPADGATLITFEDALKAVPSPRLHIQINNGLPATYVVNLVDQSLELATDVRQPLRAKEIDLVVQNPLNQPGILNNFYRGMEEPLTQGLNEALIDALIDDIQFANSFDVEVPFAFGYAFSQPLRGESSVTLPAASQILAQTGLPALDPAVGWSSTLASATVPGMTLGSIVPTGMPISASARQAQVADAVWQGLAEELMIMLDYPVESYNFWKQAAKEIFTGINAGYNQINQNYSGWFGPYHYTVTIDVLPPEAETVLYNNLKALGQELLPRWQNQLVWEGPMTVYYDSAAITHLLPTGVTGKTVLPTTQPSTKPGLFGWIGNIISSIINSILSSFGWFFNSWLG
jgi:hypothetical protein